MTTTTIEKVTLDRPEKPLLVKGHSHTFSNYAGTVSDLAVYLTWNAKRLLTDKATKPKPVKLARPAITAIRRLWYLATNYAINIDGTLVDDRFRTRLMDAEKIRKYGKFYAMFQNDPDCLRFQHIDQKYW